MPESQEVITTNTRFNPGGETTRTITFVVLIAYIAILAGFGAGGFFAKSEPEAKWYELVKIGFTTLGSALTLILGYYFGQREVSAVRELKQEAAKKLEEVENAEGEKRETLVSNLLKRTPSPSQPASLAAVDKSTLPTGKPSKDV